MKKERPTHEEFLLHKDRKTTEVHKKENPLRDVILGGQDGLVNALGIILGVLAATYDIKILITTVIAASIAESISMGAVAYTSALAQRDYYLSERRKEEREIEKYPELEREEVMRIYEKMGLAGQPLEEVADIITSDKKVWTDFLMSEELRIEPVNTKKILKSSYIVTISTAIGHLIPLSPFFFFTIHVSLVLAIIISALTLFFVGVYQAITLVGVWWRSGVRMLLIGLGAAVAGYIIANLFHAIT